MLPSAEPTSSPVVTWLMPVRNGMPFLPETLAAIEAQDFPHAHALYAWDNGSTDGSVEELHRWVPHRIPGRVFTGTAATVGGCLARLVEAAPSELCARIDADDVPAPGRLSAQVEFLDRHPEVAAVGSQVETIGGDGAPVTVRREPYYERHDDIVHQLLYRCALRHPAVTFRRSAVLAVGNYPDMQPTEDYDLFLRLAARYKLANLPQPLLRYRFHAASISQTLPDWPRYQREVRSRVFARHAAALFGLDEAAARKLACQELRCALPSLLRVVRHLERAGAVGWRTRLSSRSFQDSAAKLVRRRDRLTRLVLAGCRAGSAERLLPAAAASSSVECVVGA